MRRWKRPAIIVLAIVTIASLPFFSRQFALRGLPDVGDPFDTSKFGHVDIADKDNAYVEYSTASKMVPSPVDRKAHDEAKVVEKYGWSNGGPALKNWLTAAKPALDVWRAGTEKSDALPDRQKNINYININGYYGYSFFYFIPLATSEASKLESAGKMEEAFGWYRAILRSGRHVVIRGGVMERWASIGDHDDTAERINRWAKDARVDAKMLRSALADVRAINRTTLPLSNTFRIEYFAAMNMLQDPSAIKSFLSDVRDIQYMRPGADEVGAFSYVRSKVVRWTSDRNDDSQILARNEPERSKRVIRLIVANVLSHCDDPPSRRPPRADTNLLLFQTSAADPPAARALSPESIQKWYRTTIYAQLFLDGWLSAQIAFDRERIIQKEMEANLEEQLRRREKKD